MLILLSLSPLCSAAQRELLQLFVTDPYLELHTGPGRGYPVSQVVARGDSVDVLYRRTEWFKVRTERGIEGWASEDSLQRTRLADGSAFKIDRGNRDGYRTHNWEFGMLVGDYAGASEFGGLAAYSLTDNLKAELYGAQFLGNIYNGYIAGLGIEPCVHARMALLAVCDAGHRDGARGAQDHAGQTGQPDLPDRLRGIRRTLLPGQALFSARRIPQPHGIHQYRFERGENGMENRLRILLLASLLTTASGCSTLHRLWPWHREVDAQVAAQKADADADAAAAAADTAAAPTVIEPQVVRRKIKVPKIKAKNIELGANYGEISIESYTAAPVWGLTADYHITEDFFFEAAGGRAVAGQTSFETLSGDIQLLTDAERQFTYYNLSVGYNFLPGEVFLGRNHAMTSGFYILGGMGGVQI